MQNGGSKSRYRVLIVDSDPDACATLAQVLDYHGYETRFCCAAAEGLLVAAGFLPHACVAGICMPDMDGYAFAGLLRQRRVHDQMKLIALTGYASDHHRVKAEEAGFDLHLSKPVTITLLLASISAACNAGAGFADSRHEPAT